MIQLVNNVIPNVNNVLLKFNVQNVYKMVKLILIMFQLVRIVNPLVNNVIIQDVQNVHLCIIYNNNNVFIVLIIVYNVQVLNVYNVLMDII